MEDDPNLQEVIFIAFSNYVLNKSKTMVLDLLKMKRRTFSLSLFEKSFTDADYVERALPNLLNESLIVVIL
jgi:hypothetical protein